jgi:hypothetical protein
MVEAPGDSRLLSETEIGDTWVDVKQMRIRSYLLLLLLVIVLQIIGGISFLPLLLIVIVVGFVHGKLVGARIVRMKAGLDVIAVSSGHPWHDSEGTAETVVFVRDDEGNWVALEPNVRLVATKDPLLERSLLRDNDPEGEVLVRWSGEADSRIIAIINMAQALANAQDRGEDEGDSFEAAREREETAEGLLEREWMDTEEGAIDYEPGAILRAFKRSKDGDDDP